MTGSNDLLRFVVTGAGGFLGRHLVRHLLMNTDYQIVAVSSRSPEEVIGQIKDADDGELTGLDRLSVISNGQLTVPGFLTSDDVVVSCAFPWNRGGVQLAEGMFFLRDLMKASAAADVRTFINVSSQSVYRSGRTEPAREDSELDCDSPYATAKVAMEILAEEIIDPKALVTVRMGSLIGRGYDIRIVNRFVKQALAGEPIVVTDGGKAFSYLDVRDACRALRIIGEGRTDNDVRVVNVGASEGTTLEEIGRASQAAAQVVHASFTAGPKRDQVGSFRPQSTLDVHVVRALYGFEPQIGLPESARWIAGGAPADFESRSLGAPGVSCPEGPGRSGASIEVFEEG